MNPSDTKELARLQDVRAEAVRFISKLDRCIENLHKPAEIEKMPKNHEWEKEARWKAEARIQTLASNAACKRSSLDLWRRLAAYRRGE